MAKSKEKITARILRRDGKSIKEIAKRVSVSKSTVSAWCNDIVLSKKQIERLQQNIARGSYAGRMIGAKMQHDRKQKKIREFQISGLKEVGTISNRDLLMVGIGLYLGEGNKGGNTAQIVNSNTQIILCAIKWLSLFGVTPNDLHCHVLINEMHKSRIEAIQKQWSTITKIPLSQFNKAVFIQSQHKKIYENNDNYLGTLVLRVYKSSNLQYKILGLLEGLLYKLNGAKPT